MPKGFKRILVLTGSLLVIGFFVVHKTPYISETPTLMNSVAFPSLTPKLITISTPAVNLLQVYSATLNKNNTLVLRLPVSSNSIGKLQHELLTKSSQLSPNDTIYLVLDTPGGDVDAGNKFIDVAKSVPQKITTITRFAASMGFQIVEHLGPRLILTHGVLMSHHAHIEGFGGDIPGNGVTRLNALIRDLDIADMEIAARMHLSFDSYRELIKHEYWVTGPDAVRDHAADAIVSPICDSSLTGTYIEKIQTMFGDISVTFSECPLISEPLGVAFSKESEDLKKLYYKMFEKRELFVKDYVKAGIVSRIIK